jgi:hypothetical protein
LQVDYVFEYCVYLHGCAAFSPCAAEAMLPAAPQRTEAAVTSRDNVTQEEEEFTKLYSD